MKYISTRNNSPSITFKEALWRPLAPDGGLYLPENIPTLPEAVLANMQRMTLPEIGYVVLRATIGDEFSSAEIKNIVDSALTFDAPIVNLSDHLGVIELFEGPTLAFKDFGARIMARLLDVNGDSIHSKHPLNILIATTGNTGSAMASALRRVKNVNVFIVFPRGTAGRALESQFTTLGGNIYPIEVNGSLDACHTLVATALNDPELKKTYNLSSANSGNIARILGQTIYYFYGVSRIQANAPRGRRKVAIAVPSGNLGNLTAGIIAKRMGLPVSRFIACENSNNYLTRSLVDENFDPHPAVPTLAYAADKSVPTNLERILSLYDSDIDAMRRDIYPVTSSDADIIQSINECYNAHRYLIDPHTALAYKGIKESLNDDESGLILATAHPAKSLTAMSAITGRPIDLPLQLTKFMTGIDHRTRIKPIYNMLRRVIREANDNNPLHNHGKQTHY